MTTFQESGMTEGSIQKTLGEMDQLLVRVYNQHALPGLAVGIVHNGQLVYSRAFGFADIEAKIPVTNDTVFRIMSISKTFTAVGIMQLWEQGRFDLDEPVNGYLKSMKVLHRDLEAPPVTFRHLLTHTSGIGEAPSIPFLMHPVVGLAARPDMPIETMPELYNGRLAPELYPGEKWSYSNHAFAVLAQLIEDISGQAFAQYMREFVFETLGMQSTDTILSPRVRDRLAQGYLFKQGRFVPYPYLRLRTPGCGGIFSTLNDMAIYGSALMNGGQNEHGSVLKPETLQMMMTSQLDTDPRVFSQGLAFMLEHYGDYLVAEHSGGWPGFISSMRVIPEAKLAMLAFTNVSSGAPGLITRDILHRLLGLPLPTEKIPDPSILKRPYDWPEFCGAYGPKPGPLTNFRFWSSMGGEIEVYVKNAQLMVRGLIGPVAKGIPIYRADPHDPYLYKGIFEKNVLTFLFQANEEGKVVSVSSGSNVFYKRPEQESLRYRAMSVLGSLSGTLLSLVISRMIRKRQKQQPSTADE
jgi:CubicO group peptidase (beta-lactamase class C family)